jgi:hypothetical protein
MRIQYDATQTGAWCPGHLTVVTDDGSLVRACVSCYYQGQLVSSDGASCVSQCNAGEARDGQPSGNGYGFSLMYNAYGAYGYMCYNCGQRGAYISSDGAMCVSSCSAGEIVTDDGSTRACVACYNQGQLISSDGASCVSQCGAGEVLDGHNLGSGYGNQYGFSPFLNAYGAYGYTCIKCRQHYGPGAYLSGDGSTCVWGCSDGEAVSADGSTCVAVASR